MSKTTPTHAMNISLSHTAKSHLVKTFSRLTSTYPIAPGETGVVKVQYGEPTRPLHLWPIGGHDAFTITSITACGYEVIAGGSLALACLDGDFQFVFPTMQTGGELAFVVQNVGQRPRHFHGCCESVSVIEAPGAAQSIVYRVVYLPYELGEKDFAKRTMFVERSQELEGFELYAMKTVSSGLSVELEAEDDEGFRLLLDSHTPLPERNGVYMRFVKGARK